MPHALAARHGHAETPWLETLKNVKAMVPQSVPTS
jgi:hypothetical protein